MIRARTLMPDEQISEPGLYAGVSMARYHGGALCDGPSISSSGLRTIFTKSPAHYFADSPYNPDREEPEEQDHFSLGRAAHHLLLGEADFDAHFSVRPKQWDSWRTNAAQDWRADQLTAGKTVLTPAHLELVRGMRRGLEAHPLVAAGVLNGYVEQTLAVKDEATGIWLLSRPDVIPNESGDAADLKTTTNVDLQALERTVSDFRYDMQGALLRRAMREVLDLTMTSFALVWVEKAEPFCTEITEVDLATVEAAESDVTVALRTFARCLETGRWPGPGGTQNDAIPVGLTPWAQKRAEARRLFLEQELAA